MFADLKAATGHRVTVLPHISDEILIKCKYADLRVVRISGAVLVTDDGATALAKKCPQLRSLDVSHCRKITDKTMTALAKYSAHLEHLDVSILNGVTDAGVRAVCAGCRTLLDLQLNGIRRLSNAALTHVPLLRKLQTLCVRNCQDMTNEPFFIIIRQVRGCPAWITVHGRTSRHINLLVPPGCHLVVFSSSHLLIFSSCHRVILSSRSRQCKQLRTLDVSGLDQVDVGLVQRVAKYGFSLTALNCHDGFRDQFWNSPRRHSRAHNTTA